MEEKIMNEECKNCFYAKECEYKEDAVFCFPSMLRNLTGIWKIKKDKWEEKRS